jgi:hypothetical protein
MTSARGGVINIDNYALISCSENTKENREYPVVKRFERYPWMRVCR